MKKIFIVEDNPVVAELMRSQIEHYNNAEVHCFPNGRDLLANLMRNPDLIILDYLINTKPIVNGRSILRSVKQVFPTIPVIIFSGQHDMKLAVQLLKEGATDYVDKNSEHFLDELISSVDNIIRIQNIISTEKQVQIEYRSNRNQLAVFSFLGLVMTLLLFFLY